MQKETFILRTEWYEAISELDPTDQATILRNLFAYHSDQEITLDTIGVKLVWKLIEPTIFRNIESYDKRRETSVENGKNGGRPPSESVICDSYGNVLPGKQEGKHYFYIMYDYDLSLYKIGETQNLQARRLSMKRPTKFLQFICFYTFTNNSDAMNCERKCLSLFKENRIKGDWLSINDEQLEELKKYVQTILTESANNPKYPIETLSDSIYVSVSDSVYVSESESESDVSHTPSEKITDTPEYILPAPGAASEQIFYEQEICMAFQYNMEDVKLIHNKWLAARYGKLMTHKQARVDFKGYASSYKFNDTRGKPAPIRQQSQPQITSSYI